MENNNQNVLSILTFVGVVAILLLGVTGNFGGSDGITKADVESAVKAAIPAAAAPVAQPQPAAQPTPAPAPAPTVTKADPGELQAFYDTIVVDGDAEAPVTVIEFSDVECPFCQRHTNNGTLEAVKTKYEGKVNVVFAHFPLSFHPYAQKAAESLECAKKLSDDAGFLSFKKALFAKGGQPTIDVIKTVATEQGLDAAAMEECVNGGEFAQVVNDQMNFGRKLGVTGTPGNIVMNNETGEFVKVSGAVPAQAFDAAIDQFLQ